MYLDLVEELGDPFTLFERDWPEDEEESGGRHVLREAVAEAAPEPPPAPEPVSDVGFPG